jgi:hypothetical protein
MLDRLFTLLLNDLWFGLVDKLGVGELFLSTGYFLVNLSDLLRQSCTFLVKIEEIVDWKINFGGANYRGRRALGPISRFKIISGTNSRQRTEIRHVRAKERKIAVRAVEDNLDLLGRRAIELGPEISDRSNYFHQIIHLLFGFGIDPVWFHCRILLEHDGFSAVSQHLPNFLGNEGHDRVQ